MRNIYISIGLTLIFWSILFIMTPYDTLRKERDTRIEKQIQINNLLTQENVQEFLKDYETQKINYLFIAIYAYILIQFIVIVFNKKLDNWTIYMISLLASIIGLLIAFGYFLKTKDLYEDGFKSDGDYRFIFILTSAIPIILITFQICRLIYKYMFNLNPRIVGKSEFFSEPSNYIFSIFVFISGIILTIYIDLIGMLEKIINHFA